MAHSRLTFLVHRGKDYTLRHYFRSWGTAVSDRVAFRTYPGIGSTGRTSLKRLGRRLKSWRTGTLSFGEVTPGSIYAFTDLEIMAPWEIELARALALRLTGSPKTVILNDPARALLRSDLLRTLRDEGVNSFTVMRASDGIVPGRWPLFVRDEQSHDDGSISELLHSPAELSSHLTGLRNYRIDPRRRIVVEYAGAAGEDGLFRKYGAMRLGDAIVPCHVFFGRHWVVKHSTVLNEATVREEIEYIETNPHEEVLRRAFELAGIEYGRADYGVVNGRVEIWEINTNPYVIRPQYTRQESRKKALAAFSERFNKALVALCITPER
jgi:hypothetical protein